MDCYYHTKVNAIQACERCNRPICNDCLKSFEHYNTFMEWFPESQEKDSFNEIQSDYTRADYMMETLHWCIPCYYSHFNQMYNKKSNPIFKSIGIIFELLLYSFVMIIVIVSLLLSFEIHTNLETSLISENWIFLLIIYSILFLLIYRYKTNKTTKNQDELDHTKNVFLESTYSRVIELPIVCFYCKQTINEQDLTCLNINCTLGEEINPNAKEIEIQPVTSVFGIFDVLAKLPGPPQEEFEE